MDINGTNSKRIPRARNQFIATAIVNIIALLYGLFVGWTSPSIAVLMSDETPLASGKITLGEASWIAALPSAGSLVTNVLFGIIGHKVGRKKCLWLIAIPSCISWLLVCYAENVYTLYLARIVMGLVDGCLSIIMPIYFSEIAYDHIRGLLTTSMVVCSQSGLVIALLIGNYFSIYANAKLSIVLILIFSVLAAFIPETPAFLVKSNRISEATKSIRFYHRLKNVEDDEQIQFELSRLRRIFERKDGSADHFFPKWSDLMAKEAQKAIAIGIFLAIVIQCSGCVAIVNYTTIIFQETGSNLSAIMSSVVVCSIQVLGFLFAANLVERCGRKTLYLISTFGSALGFIILGIYMKLKALGYDVNEFRWVPVASFSFVLFIASVAMLSLPYVITPEIMPVPVKAFGVSMSMSMLWFFGFIVLKLLPLGMETLGMHGVVFIFSAVCILAALFVICFLPETRGKSYDEIMESFR